MANKAGLLTRFASFLLVASLATAVLPIYRVNAATGGWAEAYLKILNDSKSEIRWSSIAALADKNGVVTVEETRNSGKKVVVIANVCGDETPELMYVTIARDSSGLESINNLHIWDYVDGRVRELYSSKASSATTYYYDARGNMNGIGEGSKCHLFTASDGGLYLAFSSGDFYVEKLELRSGVLEGKYSNESIINKITHLWLASDTYHGEPEAVAVESAVEYLTQQKNILVMTLNGHPIETADPPYIDNGRTMVPVRFISEALSAKVDWNETTKTVTVTASGSTIIRLTIGDVNMTIEKDGAVETIMMDVPANIKTAGLTYPLDS